MSGSRYRRGQQRFTYRRQRPREQDADNLWRDAILKTKQADGQSDVEVLDAGLKLLSSVPVHLLSLPAEEVEEGLLLVGGHLSLLGFTGDDTAHGTSHHDLCFSFCSTLSRVLSRQGASLSVGGFGDLTRLLLQWGEVEVEARRMSGLCREVAWALAAVLQATSQQVGSQLHQRILSLLLSYLQRYSRGTISREVSHRQTSTFESWSPFALCQAALEALHRLFGLEVSGGSLAAGSDSTVSNVVGLLEQHAGEGRKPREDIHAARMYGTLLKALSTLLVVGKRDQIPHLPVVMECLVKFLDYGWQAPMARIGSGRPVGGQEQGDQFPGAGGVQQSSKYTPPHLRRTPSYETGSASSNASGSEAGSETSDSDSSFGRGGGSDRMKSVKVRLAALKVIQVICQMDAKALHQHWLMLLPSRQPLQRSPTTPHLITVLLYDPHPQVRLSAVGTIGMLLEGRPQRDYLAVAQLEQGNQGRPLVRGFTTLSMSLGRMVAALHEGLLHSVQNETKANVLSSAFRTLAAVMSTVRYERMPSSLLVNAVKGVRRRWHDLHTPEDNESLTEASALVCIRTALSVTPPSTALVAYLRDPDDGYCGTTVLSNMLQNMVNDRDGSAKSSWTLVEELIAVGGVNKAVLRAEALAALTGIAANYMDILRGQWNEFSHILDKNVPDCVLEHSGPEEKAAQHAIRFLGALLSNPVSPDEDALEDQVCNIEEAISNHLYKALRHQSPVLRTAALSAAGSIGVDVLERSTMELVRGLVMEITAMGHRDGVPAARSAACRAIGALVMAPRVLEHKDLVVGMTTALKSCLESATVSVRIAASWSLANLCDALGRLTGDVDKNALIDPLAEAANLASQDHEKVRANGVRALGHLIGMVDGDNSPQGQHSWIEDAVECLRASLSTGGAKVRWNACYAVGSLIANQSPLERVYASRRLDALLLLLIQLVSENPNFKVQTHAAAALAAAQKREYYGECLGGALTSLARRLDALDCGTSTQVRGGCAEGEEDAGSSFANFRYYEGLRRQLEDSLLHLLALVDVDKDRDMMRELTAGTGKLLLDFVGDRVDELHRTVVNDVLEGSEGRVGGQRLMHCIITLKEVFPDVFNECDRMLERLRAVATN